MQRYYFFGYHVSFVDSFGLASAQLPPQGLSVAPDFIMRGYLAPYDYVVIGKYSNEQLTVNQLKGRGSDGDYDIKEMDEKLNIPQTIQRLYDSVKKYADGKKGIVYAIDIVHAQAIAECYNALGLKSVALDSKTPCQEAQGDGGGFLTQRDRLPGEREPL